MDFEIVRRYTKIKLFYLISIKSIAYKIYQVVIVIRVFRADLHSV